MPQTVWFLKKEDNLVKYKDRTFRPNSYINLNTFVETAIKESPTIQEMVVNPLTLTTTGTSGAATLVGSTLNIPVYSSGSGGFGSGEILDLGDRMTGNAVFDVGNRI